MSGALAVVAALLARAYLFPKGAVVSANNWGNTPAQAQWLDQSQWNALGTVQPPSVQNGSTLFYPPGTNASSLSARPFHIYNAEFLSILGDSPTLSVIASSDVDPLFHEAVVWFPPTDEVFFAQNAGARAAGTGLAKSAILQKVSLDQVRSALQNTDKSTPADVSGQVDVQLVNGSVQVINPNGGTNYKDQIVFLGEGQGDNVAPAIYQLDPYPPYDTKVILDNYYGRQFNSLNDVAVNPRNKELYFTDPTYGFVQDFRPTPGLPYQVYRWNEKTGEVRAVADAFGQPNGITFSPDGSKAYVADTGAGGGFYGNNYTRPATVYAFDVASGGAFHNRTVFAHVPVGIPDGVHCDARGNVYAGVGDGVRVWNSDGVHLGTIYVGATSANFQFTRDGGMVICAETKLYYATLGVQGADITGYDYSQVS